MQAMTDGEVRAFVKKNEWATGLKVDAESRSLYYDNAESNCIELKFPEKPMQVPYFARVASFLNLEREELFYGAVLWLTLWDVGSPQLEKTGWKMVEKMRLAFVRLDRSARHPDIHFEVTKSLNSMRFCFPVLFLDGMRTYSPPETTISFTSVTTNTGLSSPGQPKFISNCYSN